MKDKDNIPKNRRKIKQKEAYEKMKQMGLEGILDEISKIDAQEGISFVTALLLNELMEKRKGDTFKGFHRQRLSSPDAMEHSRIAVRWSFLLCTYTL